MGCKALDKPKQKDKKGLWSPDEDQKLRDYVIKHGHGCWSSVPVNAGLQRNGKSCRLRWINYLRPGLKRGMYSAEEEKAILILHGMLGNKDSKYLPGRTDNDIKNHWHSHLKKRMAKSHEAENSSSMGNLESLPSSMKSTTQNSTFEHFGSLTEAEQSVSQMQFPREACKGQKILFAEWLSLDQFQDQNAAANPSIAENNFNYYNSDFQDAFMHDLFLQEGNVSNDNHRGLSNVTVESMHQTTPEFEDHFSENDLADLISGGGNSF